MRRKVLPIILAGVLVLPVLFSGCGIFRMSEELKAVQGHWVDLNGETTLDFRGKRMTVTDGDFKRTFRIRITDGELKYIENASKKGTDFYGMSPLAIGADGALTAQEMVLDAEGHQYRFVREENLAKERGYKDNQRNLPKVIESDEIEEFSLWFSLKDSHYDVPEDAVFEDGRYSIELRWQPGDYYVMHYEALAESYNLYEYEENVSAEYAKGFARIIEEQKIAEKNGYGRSNNESFRGWSLQVKYRSGELLYLTASGRPALECPFSIDAFLEYANEQVGYGLPDETTSPDAENEEILAGLSGHWTDVNSDSTLEFDGNKMYFSLYGGTADEFEVRVVGEEIKKVENTDPNDPGFYIVSQLTIREDGSLTADEMVLDADGHHFRFVRDTELEREKEVHDYSENLQKEIRSTNITELYLNFSLRDSRYDLPEDSIWERGNYGIELVEQDDGTFALDFNAIADSYVITQYQGEVSEEFVQGLAELLVSLEIPAHNGENLKNNEDFESWSLYVDYDTGEELRLSRSGRPALECPFSINAILEYLNQVVGYAEE